MENPPTFHTVSSLANNLAKKAEESKEAIQKNNAQVCEHSINLPRGA